ncbi:hypothetical protein AAHE18_03G142600 [Arachis hypogaea]
MKLEWIHQSLEKGQCLGMLLRITLLLFIHFVGYEGKNVYMASYDWKLPFENTRVQLLFQEKAFNYNFWRGTERLMDASYLVRLVEDLILKASLLLRLVQFSFFFFFE